MAASYDETEKPDATLHILQRDGSVSERGLLQPETRIGKGAHNHIILADASVSSKHAKITFINGVYNLSDLGSRNGTFLNDARITEPRELHHGDRLKMGHCTLTFRIEGADDTLMVPVSEVAAQPPPPPPSPPAPVSPAITEEALAEALVSSGLVAQTEIDRIRETGGDGDRLFAALLKKNLVSEVGLRDLISRTFNIPPVELKTMDVDVVAAAALRPQFLRENLVCPIVGRTADHHLLAIADPTDKRTIDEIELTTRKKASLRIAMPSEIEEKLDNYFTPRLIGVTSAGEKIEALLNQAEIDIGKAAHNSFVISDPTVSNTHAIIIAREGCYSIVDLGSSNGTIIDGKRLGNEAYTLQHGDKIQLGQVVLTFRNPAETTENKTARLSPEALEDVRSRIALSPPAIGVSASPAPLAFGQPIMSAVMPETLEDEEEKKEKKKKKKEDDRIKAALVNSTSRILATILGSLLTLVIAIYFLRPSPPPEPSGARNGQQEASGSKLVPSSWKDFSAGFFGSPIEASGVAHLPGANGVIVVSDNREGEVLWMPLDEDGRQAGSIKAMPLGVSFKDPESITYGNSYLYLVTSQSEPKNGAQNALVRFEFNPETQSLRGQAEIISDFRAYLLSKVPEIASLGAPAGAEGGLNIEGIAWDPNNERLLLGLRSPLVGDQAVLIPLKLRDPHGPFNIDNLSLDSPRVIVFPLDGHGVRDITYDTRSRNFLIISGAPENVRKTDFVLWEWNGQPGINPVRLMSLDEKAKPEGITVTTINGRSFVFVVGDAGSYLKLNYQ
jgi:pSer/pThr/pTyr-binding forkhead associated (FHA) protein